MNIPKDLKYTREHEWAKAVGGEIVVGITDHAQSSLGDIVYLELPKVGRTLKAGETFGVVESIKAVSDLYAPIAGEVVAINDGASGDPATLNSSPYDNGWLIRLKPADANALSALMDAGAYEKLVASLK